MVRLVGNRDVFWPDSSAQVNPVSLSLPLGLIYHRYISGDEGGALAVCWRSGCLLTLWTRSCGSASLSRLWRRRLSIGSVFRRTWVGAVWPGVRIGNTTGPSGSISGVGYPNPLPSTLAYVQPSPPSMRTSDLEWAPGFESCRRLAGCRV